MERRKALSVAATGALVFSTGLVAAVSIGGFHILGFKPHPGNSAVAAPNTTLPAAPLCTTTTITVTTATTPPATAAPLPADCTVSTTVAPVAETVANTTPPVTCAPGADPTTCPSS